MYSQQRYKLNIRKDNFDLIGHLIFVDSYKFYSWFIEDPPLFLKYVFILGMQLQLSLTLWLKSLRNL